MSEIDSILKGAPEHKPGAQSSTTAAPAAPPSEIDAALSDAPSTARGLKGWGQDIAATAAKGAIAVPEAVVGLADIPTGGRVGKFLENEGGAVGFRPKQAREAVNDWHSDATLEAQRKFQEADGIVNKAVTAVQNPSLIATAIGESLPSMGAGGVAARGLLAATRLGQLGAKGAALAGAAGEGLTMAGSQAEQIRQETPDGLLTPGQAGLAAATGAVGGAFGAAGGRIAQRLGIGDAETMLAQGQSGMARQFADEAAGAAVNPLQQQAVKSIPRHVIEGAIAEGLLEELPQSVAEQIFQNVALDKPWYDQVDSAIVLGTLSGGAMGAGAAGYHAAARPRAGAVAESDPAAALPAGDEPAADAPARNPGLERVSQAFAEQLRALQEQEQGEVLGPQSAPPDGAAALAEQRAAAAAQRQADVEASRAVESPDDEIYQSTGAEVPRSVRMGINPADGPLSTGAAMAVDTGVSDQMQQAAALAQAAEAAEKGGKAQKQEQAPRTPQAPQGADPETGEIPGPDAVANWSDAQLSEVFRGAQGRDVRIKLAQELSRRKAARAVEQSTPVKGSTDGSQPQPASTPPAAGAAQAPAAAATGAPAQGALSNAGTTTADAGAQAKAAAGAQAAPESTEQRAQRIDAAGQTWTRLPTVQRQVVAEQLKGIKPVLQKNLAGAKWDNLNGDLKRKIADLIAPAQEAAAAAAPAPASAPAAPAAPATMARGTTFPPLDAPLAPSVSPKAAGTGARAARAAAAPAAAPAVVQAAAAEAATSLSNDRPEPTPAQKDAGNYKKGHARINGHDISIENPAGTRRRPEWPPLQNHYGYIKGSKGADKDHVDVFMTDRAEDAGLPVFVVDQVNRDGTFDEHKVVMGAADEAEARSTYLGNYEKGWTGLGGITQMTQDEFKAWVRDPAKTLKPAAAPIQETSQSVAPSVAAVRAPEADPTRRPTEQQVAMEAHSLPAETEFLPGKGHAGAGKWLARVGKQQGALSNSVDEAARSLSTFMKMDAGRAAAEVQRKALASTVAEKLKRGERPTDVELRDLFGLAANHTYVDQAAVGQFLVDHMGVPRNGIRKALGAAAGDRTSDGGTKYPIAYPRKLHDVFGPQAAAGPVSVLDRMKRAKAEKAAAPAAPAAAAEESQVTEPKTVPEKMKEAKAKRESKAVREAREAEERRAAYFAPGNVIRGYGGRFDRVVSYQPAEADGRWSVTVREVQKDGAGGWEDKARAVDRTHGTEPSKVNYATGPAGRIEVDPAPAVAEAPAPAAAAGASDPASGPVAVLDAGIKEDGPGAGRITDFGEKIGGARKDQATRAPKAPKPRSSDERPAWARRFEISQIAKSNRLGEEGRWVVRDARSLDAFKQPRRVGAETYETREEAEQAVPLLAVSQKHSPVPLRGDGAGYEIWREVSDRKRVKVVDQVFPTRDAALEYMAKNAQAIIETNTTFGEADLPRPPSEERVGMPRRSGDARDSDFMDVFGFRGVEFGNWNNQQERQQLLNDAYDGLLDLAEVMGVPPRAISLDGDLALAFGARGHGLSSARAHYEPAKAVINLTKMNGAGSLAHEWFHALDHYFGRQDGKAPAEWVVGKDGTRSLEINDAAESNMVSGGTRGERSGMRPELREAFADVMRTIARKAEAYVEDTARADRFVASAREDVKRQLISIRADLARDLDPRYYKRFNKAAPADQLAEFDSVAEKILAGELLDLRVESKGSARSIASGMRWTNDALNRISAVMKAVRGRQGFSAAQDGPLDRMSGLMRNYSARLKMLADAQQANEKSRMVPTDFVMSAKELDQGRGQDYWTRPHELAARAFQGYVEDKIAASGGRSPFLNYGPEGAAIPTPWGFKRPFPAGAERVAINQALERLAGTIQTRESDSGGVALFRRGTEDDLGAGMARDLLRIMGKGDGFSAAAQRQAVDTVRATVNPIVAAWQNAPGVVVAYDLNDPIIPQRVRDADLRQRSGGAHGSPEGFYFGGKAYLMASRLTTPADVARVLYHEVAGHHGLRGLFGKELDKILNQVATMRRADVDAKMAEYGMRGVDRISRIRAAEEVLAEMAEKNPQQSFVQRAVAAIRNFLRAHVPGFGSLRLRDADIIQAYILPARNWVERDAAAREREMGSAAMQYSLAQDEARSGFAAEVRAAITAGLNNDERALRAQVPLGIETPAALEALGVVRKPVVTNRNLIAKMHFEHGVPRAELERLGELLSNPVMVFKSDTQPGRMVVVTSLVVRGNPVVVAVDPNGVSNRAEVVYVPSAYPKDNADRTFTRWIRDGLLQFANKKESRQLATTARLQLPGVVQRAAGFRADYKTEADLPQTGDGPDVMFSRERIAALKDSALAQITETMSHPGKVSLWDKTIGTMRNLAERAPAFKPVFESAQRFIDDVSMLGNDAADMAPRLLPRVDSWRDLTKKPITAADNKAVARPLFEGTLMWARDIDGTPVLLDDLTAKYQALPADQKAQLLLRGGRLDPKILTAWQGLPVGMYEANVNSSFNSRVLKAGVVWSQKELETMFGLDANQVSLYREGRAAIDRSIDMTARADMLRSLGEEYAGMRDAVLAQETLDDAVELLTRTLMDDARDRPEWSERLMELNNAVVKAQEKAQQLMDEGYAPLSRFGRYTVDVVDAAGERQYFGMFETKADSNRMKAEMEKQFPGATVTQGTMSQDAFKLFAGVTPESLEMFGSMLGLDGKGDDPKDKAFQAYLQLAKNNHSALKRLIHRKGIAGYSEDVGRVLASFVYSNARLGAGGLNAGTMENAINAIPKEEGELKDLAMGLRDYIANPQEEGQAVRGMLFAQYLGGSLASAFVNMTQPFAVTLPWLTQFGGMKRAGAQMARALKDMSRKGFQYEPDLAAAMQSAEEDGVVSPQEIHQLMAQARGTGSLRTGDGTKAGDARAAVANNWERVKVAWGQPFALAEQFNRRSTFIAAYRIAKEQGMAEPSNFARKAVLETQFLYSKANKMRFARGAVGGTLMTFKTYSVSYLELMHRMWTQGGPEGKRAVGWAVAMLLLMSGAGGLPFMEDAEDLIDGAGQLMGYNLSAKQWRKQALRDVVGKEVAEFLEQGLSGLPGAPVDVSGRLGMGNLLPGTGLFLSKQNRERDLLEVAGPAGDVVARGFTAVRKGLTGDVGGAALELSPTAVRNAVKGVDMAATGIYKDKKGYKVIDTTLAEAGSKFLGFQPKSVAEVQEANSFMLRTKSFYTQTSSEIKAQWADALYRKDDAALAEARERLADWNRNNPEQPIVVRMPDVWKRVREMDKDRTQRIADTAPKALRQQMRETAREAG